MGALGASAAVIIVEELGVRVGDELVRDVEVGQQVSISTRVTNRIDRDQEATILTELRDGSGITMYLAWHYAKIRANSNYTTESSWLVEGGCMGAPVECRNDYQIRSFPVTNLTNPQVLGPVITAEGITVTDALERVIELYRLEVDANEYEIEYSLPRGDVGVIYADQELLTIGVSFQQILADTSLSITFPKSLGRNLSTF